MADALPVLWIYGPGGVGKTTAAWEYYRRLVAAGVRAGYVDIDQLGMCYGPPTAENWAPEPASDPVRHRLKTLNLDAVAAHHRALGSRCLVVGGIVDPEHGVDADSLPNADLTPCRLRAEPEELARRITARGRDTDELADVLRDARQLDLRDFPGARVDTTGLSVDEVLARIAQETGGWPWLAVDEPHDEQLEGRSADDGPSAEADAASGAGSGAGSGVRSGAVSRASIQRSITYTDAPGEILFVCGPTAVGKSVVAYFAYSGSRRLGQHTAFADLDQLGFQGPASAADPRNHRLKAANLAALWRNFHARGARRLVVNGPLDRPEDLRVYRDALPSARLTVARLHASFGQLGVRIAERAAGAGAVRGLAGDGILGRTGEALRAVLDRAAAEAAALDRAGVGDLRAATDGRTPGDIARELLRRAAWS